MFNLFVNLGPSLHFCKKISEYIKLFFLNFKTKYSLQTTKWPNYKIMQGSLSVPLTTHLGHHAQDFLLMKEPQRD